ncbi:RNA polymerase-binding protein DksA [Ottowia sp.]|uniref:RNA polymerase-binding protein DksA n=1 Tax=Ottowia sp. TaxID=1898956 RepID=UPI002BA451F2|nr:RNA polymerase-binding protein DksA [Pseudomonadota bacterium]HOV20488.1 RNA polymerase-binding protein DksA [Ottowia sp.]
MPDKAAPKPGARTATAVVKKAAPAREPTAPARKSTPPKAVAPPAAQTKTLPMPIAAAAPMPIVIKKDPRLANNWKTKTADELSDAEVIAMPDAEYMNDKQLAFFRIKLVQLKDDILQNADQTTEQLRKDTVVVPDPADRATIEEEHALELRTRDRERKLLKKIEQSIARIDSGDYGYCDETGEPIGVPRLLARPTATLSLEAQQRRELKQKMFGD